MSVRVSRWTRLAVVAIAAAVGLAALTVPASVTPASANASSYSLSVQTYPDGRRVVARWNPCQKAITYRVNTKYAAKTKAGRARALRDVKKAVSRVSKATGIRFRYVGRSTLIPKDTRGSSWAAREKHAEVYVAWVKQSKKSARTNLLGVSGGRWAAGTGGYAYKFWKVGDDPWSGVTGRGFVVLDSAQNKKFKSGFGSGTTRGDLLMHELGHVMGLNHVSKSSQVMYPTIRRHSVSAYASGDRAGLRRLGRSAGCIGVPGWVWKDLS
jgi:hypothetical protein